MSGPPPPPRRRKLIQQVEESRKSSEDFPGDVQKYYISNGLTGTPDTTIGQGVRIEGDLVFDRLLQIDGSFYGELHSRGDVIIGSNGSFEGEMKGIRTVLVDGGIIKGLLEVESIIAINSAKIFGNIACKKFSSDKSVCIAGRVNIHNRSPELVDINGEIIVDEIDELDNDIYDVDDIEIDSQVSSKPDIISSSGPRIEVDGPVDSDLRPTLDISKDGIPMTDSDSLHLNEVPPSNSSGHADSTDVNANNPGNTDPVADFVGVVVENAAEANSEK